MNTIKYILLILSTLSLFLSIAVNANEQEDAAIDFDQKSESSKLMPNYGNWCGLNHPRDINRAKEPIDYLDSICKAHDYCYLKKGYLSCECDSDFTNSVALGLKENKFTGKEKLFFHTFRTYFKNSPCSGDHSNKLAPTRIVHNIVNKAETFSKDVLDMLPFIGDHEYEPPMREEVGNN